MDQYILTIVAALPLVGIFLLLLVNRKAESTLKGIAFAVSLITFIVSLYIYFRFDSSTDAMQFVVNIPWISSLGISYHVGIDGLSIWLFILTTFLSWLSIWSSWNAIKDRLKGFLISMLLLEVGMVGVFMSLDLFLFYVFWELMLIPMYFLIGIWGGANKVYATIKFVLFTLVGSLLMLVAIVALFVMHYYANGFYSFDLTRMGDLVIGSSIQMWLFAAFALAFVIKVPMFPFHTWLPDAHVQAPTAGSVILAGVLLKMGTYGFLRFCIPLFPAAFVQFVPLISVLAIIGIIYGALVAMVQKDVKSLVAFSSVSHLGFVMLGMAALNMQGMEGSIIQMINHGISTGALFLIVGMIYERRHTRLIADLGGLFTSMPVWTTFFIIVTLSSIGLPFTNGFVGEFLILLGTFKANVAYAVIAAIGIVLAAGYMLWMLQRVVFGEITREENRNLTDINLREKLILLPLTVLIFWIGIYPNTFFKPMEKSIGSLLLKVSYVQNEEVPQLLDGVEYSDGNAADNEKEVD
ncbi:MAG: NADH-quinone oxidoreductase subunit M [candidate division Zixibacteria bacterium]|nr:NADH-quinone oxidoreductase subunit M [candidate division Zixibacteria bacterium]MBU1471887.1 NADH-quinone oxidoreductase subunit M [candidate division Zixibacteria bacterium]MBU2625583.1 NADH-quinone oxidoreductase subunit M [candidate division Zixibacteria bacterium]